MSKTRVVSMKTSTFGRWLESKRTALSSRLSQAQVALHLGINENTYRNIENDKGMDLTLSHCRKLEQLFRLPEGQVWTYLVDFQRNKVRKKDRVIGHILQWYQDELDARDELIRREGGDIYKAIAALGTANTPHDVERPVNLEAALVSLLETPGVPMMNKVEVLTRWGAMPSDARAGTFELLQQHMKMMVRERHRGLNARMKQIREDGYELEMED